MNKELIKKSFLFIPFSIEASNGKESIETISKMFGKDSEHLWLKIDDVYPATNVIFDETEKNDIYNGSFNARYMLDYVAGRIGSTTDENDNMICIQRFAIIDKLIEQNKLKILSDNKVVVAPPIGDDRLVDAVNIQRAFLFCFSTGINLLSLEVCFAPDAEYTEVANTLFWMKNIKDKNIMSGQNKEKFSIADISLDIINALMGNTNINIDFETGYSHKKFQRDFVLTYYETNLLEKNETDKVLFATSHCYRERMISNGETDDICETYQNNSACKWAITSGGAACVVHRNTSNDDFIVNRFRDDINGGYLLAFALLLNQKYRLYQFLSNISRELDISGNDIETCYKYRNEFYDFEHNYNFRVITELPQYQNVYYIGYKMFRINQLMEDVEEPLEAINTILREKHYEEEKALKEKENEERRLAEEKENENDRITNNALTLLSILAIFSALVDAWDYIDELVFENTLRNWIQIIVSFLLGVIFVIAVCKSKILSKTFRKGNEPKKQNKKERKKEK